MIINPNNIISKVKVEIFIRILILCCTYTSNYLYFKHYLCMIDQNKVLANILVKT